MQRLEQAGNATLTRLSTCLFCQSRAVFGELHAPFSQVAMQLLFVVLMLFVTACSNDGISGTGETPPDTHVTGTAAIGSPLAKTTIELKDVKGQKKQTETDDAGKFSFDVKGMSAPFLVRVHTSDGKSLFSIATQAGITNIHPFTNVLVRNWFVARDRDVESEFDDNSAINSPPTAKQINAIKNAIISLLELAYEEFGIAVDFDFVNTDFTADNTGFDWLLDHVIIQLSKNKLTIKIIDPDTGVESIIVVKFDLGVEISEPETNVKPSVPQNVVALAKGSAEIVVLWNTAKDVVGVRGYNIYRDGMLIGNSVYPVFVDTGLTAGTDYCYQVEAINAAGNVSETRSDLTTAACAKTETVTDTQAPSVPVGVNAQTIDSDTMHLTWTASPESDVVGYHIYRRLNVTGAEEKVATVIATSYDDFSLTAGTTYCYTITAFDAVPNESGHSTPLTCADTFATPDNTAPATSVKPAGGVYAVVQTVTLACDDVGGAGCAAIYYTVDGTDPTRNSAVYSIPLTINADTTLKFFAEDLAGNDEAIHTESYIIGTLPVSSANPAGGSYNTAQSVSLYCDKSVCTIYYTTDGSTPTTASTQYSAPIVLSSTTTLKFFAVDSDGHQEAAVNEEVYNISAADTEAPVNTTVTNFIDGGAAQTGATSVMLDISATDNTAVTAYCAMDNKTGVEPVPDANCWQTIAAPAASYSTTVSYTLTDSYADGDNVNVFLWFRDGALNQSSSATDSIAFATGNAPINTMGANFINHGAATTSSPSVTLSLSATDADGDMNAYYVAATTSAATPAQPGVADSGWVPISQTQDFSGDVRFMFPGTPASGDTVYAHVWFKDAAGNVSNAVTDDIQIVTSVVYSDGFENGLGLWSASNGLWEVGTPASPPNACNSGNQCAGTVLAGNYPDWTNSRLESYSINLPSIAAGEELHLRFWHWFSMNGYDRARVQVATETSPGVWAWTTLETYYYSSSVWSNAMVDLSAYAGQRIKIGFLLDQDPTYAGVGPGWYIDDVSITKVSGLPAAVPSVTDFETGIGNWSAWNGLWEVGDATGGPGSCYSGSVCAGTVLGGNYPDWTDSRLVSPSFDVPALAAGEELQLRFWQWFSMNGYDRARVQVATETSPGVWGTWTTVETYYYSSGTWTNAMVDMSAYAGQKIKIAFLLNQDPTYAGVGVGWYVDDISLQVVSGLPLALPFNDDLEGGIGNWSAWNGLWEVGDATGGPGSCYSGSVCAGTVLAGNYPEWTDSRLVSPSIDLPVLATGESLNLRFEHWFNLNSYDQAIVQIAAETAPGVWGAWQDLSTYTLSSGGWTYPLLDLSAYAGQKVKIAFLLNQDPTYSGVGPGWYIDDITVFKLP